MKKINAMRAKLLHSMFETGSCEVVSTSIVKDLFKRTPSYFEIQKCSQCKNSVRAYFYTVHVDNAKYKNDLKKLEESVNTNFANRGYCHHCQKPSEIINREFQDHLFIEVKICESTHNIAKELKRQTLKNLNYQFLSDVVV